MPFRRKKTFVEHAQDYVEQVTEAVKPQLEHAVEQTRAKAGPALADAKALAAEKAKEAKVKAGPALAEAKALAAERAAESRELAAAKVAELKGEEPKHKGGKLKKLVLISGLLAIGGLIFKKVRGSQDSGNWQSSYVPTPPPSPRPPAEKPVAAAASAAPASQVGDPLSDPLTDPLPDDAAGGAPGEALSDSVEEPHRTTTPDQPADVIDVDDVPDNKSPGDS